MNLLSTRITSLIFCVALLSSCGRTSNSSSPASSTHSYTPVPDNLVLTYFNGTFWAPETLVTSPDQPYGIKTSQVHYQSCFSASDITHTWIIDSQSMNYYYQDNDTTKIILSFGPQIPTEAQDRLVATYDISTRVLTENKKELRGGIYHMANSFEQQFLQNMCKFSY